MKKTMSAPSLSPEDIQKLAIFRKLLSDSKKSGDSSDITFNKALSLLLNKDRHYLMTSQQRAQLLYPPERSPRKTEDENKRDYLCMSSRGYGSSYPRSTAIPWNRKAPTNAI